MSSPSISKRIDNDENWRTPMVVELLSPFGRRYVEVSVCDEESGAVSLSCNVFRGSDTSITFEEDQFEELIDRLQRARAVALGRD